jgi:ABC-type oligopeptide transport system ATPase subunit
MNWNCEQFGKISFFRVEVKLNVDDRYMALDKSGRVDQLADLHDLAEVQSVTEDELRMAIEELGKSTETVSKQTETLRQQHDAMSRLATKQRENATRREELHQVRRRQSELERAQLAKEVRPNLNSCLGDG